MAETGSGNRLGDLELTDPGAMRALAHPVRLAILDHLRRSGPATATELSPEVGATPSVTSWHLRHLAKFGLTRDSAADPERPDRGDRRERRWEAVGRGFRFRLPEDLEDTEGAAAARALSEHMMLTYAELPHRWVNDVEPHLEPDWVRVSGMANTRVVISIDEAARIEDEIERILAPYVMREPADRPAGSRGVRLLRYALAEGADERSGP